ncbi:hypothetical protein CGMCC3_g9691 [Colletotrichum fructicola]|uniref:Uncharacterized protein n=1 Tax=Colletotrichum fructicola (strain Nara gc5) TaxID=1213859 RepID=A0A7J6IE63_COLFN|nr:uncharacterized protein CGMCC3_g9691 [Colletotrichum fructicola]KAE9574442.1 hypothetical protein CGMCC3_g9691 [Colletotrichum fructicola]KAF4431731.1 hypothetical protein CFRS1_v011304 [Colletotrichum fructicola]KAF4474136.1 hypothetical protein CGGC5_v016764 [Colletotrichum fructicola Nara gc5]
MYSKCAGQRYLPFPPANPANPLDPTTLLRPPPPPTEAGVDWISSAAPGSGTDSGSRLSLFAICCRRTTSVVTSARPNLVEWFVHTSSTLSYQNTDHQTRVFYPQQDRPPTPSFWRRELRPTFPFFKTVLRLSFFLLPDFLHPVSRGSWIPDAPTINLS